MSQQSIMFFKAKRLAVLGINTARYLRVDVSEHDISRQLMRSMTAPGALIAEATDSESSADMHHKLGIALKECRESQYWIDVLIECRILNAELVDELLQTLNEVTAMLVASRKTLKLRIK